MKTGTIEDAMVRVQVVLGERSLSVDLVAAGEVVARGEVVVIDEAFGIRVTELAGRGDAP